MSEQIETARSPNVVGRLSEEDLRSFVHGLVDGRIYTIHHGPDAKDAFMLLGLGALEGWTKEEIGQIGTVYEWIEKAGPLAVNGNPTFLSLRLLHKDDWSAALAAAAEEEQRRKMISVGASPQVSAEKP